MQHNGTGDKLPMKKFTLLKYLPVLLPVLLIGCATSGVADYRSTGINENVVLEPTIGNGYKGVLVEMPPSPEGALLTRAHEICSTRGGLLEAPRYTHSVPIGWKFYSYRCSGVQRVAPPAPNLVEQTQPRTPPANPSVGMVEAKSKCIELGFKVGTEALGNCVLKLSK
jgi:hypothetical protein